METYRRLVEDWRHYDNLLWQIPFGTAAAVGIVLTLVYYYLHGSGTGTVTLKLGLLFILIIFVLTMMFLSIKIRYFQIERAICIEEIEQTCAKVKVPYNTKGAYSIIDKEAPFEGSVGKAIRAYHLQIILFISIIAVLIVIMITTAQQYLLTLFKMAISWPAMIVIWLLLIFICLVIIVLIIILCKLIYYSLKDI